MSGVIDLSGVPGGGAPHRAGVSARMPTLSSSRDSYDLVIGSESEEEQPQPAGRAGARARREAEIRAGWYRSQASGVADDGGWGSSARAATDSTTAGRHNDAYTRARPAAASTSPDGAFGGIEDHEEDACCPERCPQCLLCASAQPCHGRQVCLCEKVEDRDGQSEEERQRNRRIQKEREERLLRMAMQKSMMDSQRAPQTADDDDFEKQMAEAMRQSAEEARLQEIANGQVEGVAQAAAAPVAPGTAAVSAASSAARPRSSFGTKRPRPDSVTQRPRKSKNARPSQDTVVEPDRRSAAADAADRREMAALKQQLADRDAAIARMENERRGSVTMSPQSAPGSAPGSPSVQQSAEDLQQRFAREKSQLQQRQLQLERQQLQLKRERIELQHRQADLEKENSQLKRSLQSKRRTESEPIGIAFKRKREAYHHSTWSHRKLWCEMGKKDKKGVTFSVRRAPAHFLKDSCSKIAKLSRRQLMTSPIWVKFEGEDAVDEGGVTREFWSMIGEIISPTVNRSDAKAGGDALGSAQADGQPQLFEQLSDEPGAAFLPAASATNKESLELFYGLGILISRMLLDSAAPLDIAKASTSCARPFECNFGLLCLRYVLWRDPDGSEGLSDMKVCHATADLGNSSGDDGSIAGDTDALFSLVREGHGADGLASSMSALLSQSLGGDTTLGELSLVDNEENRRLSALKLSDRVPETKTHAVVALLHHKLLATRRMQLEALRDGFVYAGGTYGTDWWKQLRMFDDAELLELLWQPSEVDVEAVLSMLIFRSFEPSHKTPTWLKDLLREATNEELRKFLRWCTGTAAVSANSTASPQDAGASFANISDSGAASSASAAATITVQWEPEYERTGSTRSRFPTASTCARSVILPEYETKEKLKELLYTAVDEQVFRAQ